MLLNLRTISILLLFAASLICSPFAIAQALPAGSATPAQSSASMNPSLGPAASNNNGTNHEGNSTGGSPSIPTNGTSIDNDTSPTYLVTEKHPVPVPAGATWKHWSKLDPNDPNVLVNFTGSTTTVYASLSATTDNYLSGSSCGAPPCTPNNGNFSYQWNIVFPKDSNFMIQAVIEFDTVSNSCYAHAQSSTGSPGTSTYSFSCSSLTAPGDDFEWVVSTTSSDFNTIEFELNGVVEKTWTSSNVFGCTAPCISMTDVYGQSVWAGAESGPLSETYANMYSGAGDMDYTGVHNFNCGSASCVIVVTVEYSNAQYTNLSGSGSTWSQTYLAGSFLTSYVTSGTTGGGSVANPSYIVGQPDGSYAELRGPNSGDSAYDEASFGNAYNGTIAIYGYSYNNGGGAYYSYVQVAVSSTGSSWTTVYSDTWNPSSSNTPTWIPVASVTGMEYVKVTVSYNSGDSANIYIDAISIFIGSYVQSQPAGGYGTTGGGSVTNPTDIVGLPDSALTELRAPNSGDSAWAEGNFGTLYSGELVVDGYSYNNGGGAYYSYLTVQVSSTGSSWTTVYQNTWNPSGTNTPTWITVGSVSNIQYVKVTVTYNSGDSANLYIDAIYVA